MITFPDLIALLGLGWLYYIFFWSLPIRRDQESPWENVARYHIWPLMLAWAVYSVYWLISTVA